MIDLTKLTPAPWIYVVPEGYTSGAEGRMPEFVGVMNFGNNTQYYPIEGEPPSATDAEFVTLARNAFDVMTRRGWSVIPSAVIVGGVPNGWHASRWDGKDWMPIWVDDNLWFPDPFTALVEADAATSKLEK